MIRIGIIATIGAGLLAAGAAAGAQTIVVGSGPPQPAPGSGNSSRTASDNRELQAVVNQRMGAARLNSRTDRKAKPQAVPATLVDIKAGAALRDVNGVALGTVVAISGDEAVVDTGLTKIGVPLIAFGKDNKGLLLGISAEQFNHLVIAVLAKPQASI
jgi:hypothetical protein